MTGRLDLDSAGARALFARLYGPAMERGLERAAALKRAFERAFPGSPELFSSPGRTEVGGNHTDHNGGRVLAATVNVDILAAAAARDDHRIAIESDGYGRIEVDLARLAFDERERFTPRALVKGVCARLRELGYAAGGFNAVMSSTIPKAAGLSSSAAFECLVTEIQNRLYNRGAISAVQNAAISQFAENHYFGKPCGLMDQTTIAVGGLVAIDFRDFEAPEVRSLEVDFARSGYSLLVVDTGGSHADLNDDYIALEHEMKAVAQALGGAVLRDTSAAQVLREAPRLRGAVGDRALLRALHFHDDDARVAAQVRALEDGDFRRFLGLVIESGRSSFMHCQNCYVPRLPREQGVPLALALSERVLEGVGAWRVHGGGFAGTIQAFVPATHRERYVAALGAVFGPGSCHELSIRPDGARCLTL